jgi:CheY-like chemotaxis protein
MTNPRFSVLLIDDDDTTADLFDLVMGFNNIAFTRVTSAELAFDYLQKQKPDVIVIDIFMPGLDGYQTLNKIRGNHLADGIRCIATTSYHTADTPAALANYGFDGYLPKPLETNSLVAYLVNMLAQPNNP